MSSFCEDNEVASPSENRWVARALRVVVEDETGIKPTFEVCYDIVERSGGRDFTMSAEEQACRLYLLNRDELILSVKQRTTKRPA